MAEKVRLGYHVVSDDSVNSAYVDAIEAIKSITEMMNKDFDVDHIWIRNKNDVVVWEWRRNQESS